MAGKDLVARQFGIALDDAMKAVSRMVVRGADLGELFLEDTIRTYISQEDGRIRDVGYVEDSGAGLRAVKGDTQAYGYTQKMDPVELLRIAGEVSSVADGTGGTKVITPAGSVPMPQRLYSGEHPSVLVPARDKLDLLARADKAARAYSPFVKQVDVGLSEEIRVLGLVNSAGALFVDLQPMLTFRVTVVAEKDGKRQQGYAAGGGRAGLEYFDGVSPESVAKKAAHLAVDMLDAKPAPAGEQVVVLAPGDSGVLLHEAVGHGLEADFNRKGTSKYSGRVGQPVASRLCTVVDEGLQPASRGAIHVDDEGAPATRNVLIEDGILKGYMHDHISARHYGLAPSGNGRREAYRFPPMPRMTCTYMLPGTATPEEVIASVKKGIYCQTFSGGQVNISNGDFVFQVVESYLIEEGKLTAPLKDVVIIGNGPDALSKVAMVGNDLVQSDGRWTCGKGDQRVPVGVGIPTTRIDGITVGGTA
ncbi:MAG: metalloprotease TldD [Deltaproteobacteria bacterium]|nr:metalloprotease TldD [Deltaproteobacteria bacterium]